MSKASSIYTIRELQAPPGRDVNVFSVSKMTEDYEVQAEYLIEESSRGGLICTCPAHKKWCRHMDILRKFQAEERIGTGYFFNFDKNLWIEPIQTTEN